MTCRDIIHGALGSQPVSLAGILVSHCATRSVLYLQDIQRYSCNSDRRREIQSWVISKLLKIYSVSGLEASRLQPYISSPTQFPVDFWLKPCPDTHTLLE